MQLECTCRAKAENVSRPPKSYNGVKFMLHFKSPSPGSRWHNVSQVHGTFDWKELSFVAPIPDDAAQGELDLGLQMESQPEWPRADYFKVRGTNGHDYLLKHDLESDEWFLGKEW